MNANHAAFLSMIAHAEGTDRAVDPYKVCFAFKHVCLDLSTHPAVSGEWDGEPLDFLGPNYRGLKSTAAGRYQITKATFLELSAALGTHDFFPFTQDAMALELVKRAGALAYVQLGMLDQAIERCSHIWASLPGSSSGQPQRSLAMLQTSYVSFGGTLGAATA